MNYSELFNKYMQGLTSMDEDIALFEWVKRPDAKDTIYHYFEEKWKETEGMSMPADLQQQMLDEIRLKLNMKAEQPQQQQTKVLTMTSWQSLFNYAASVLLIGLMAVTYYLYQSTYNNISTVTVCAEKGQQSNVTLPDGTKVWLNSDSRLMYATNFGRDDRKVKLEGEAYFEVAKDRQHRFIVATDRLDIEALGTAFNVRAYDTSKNIYTTLVEGKVSVKAGNREMLMEPDEEVIYSRDTYKLEKKEVDNTDYATGWMKNQFSFNGATLEDITQELSRMYNLTIVFGSEEIKYYHFRGVIKNNSLTNILDIIKLTAPIEYEVRHDSIFLSKK